MSLKRFLLRNFPILYPVPRVPNIGTLATEKFLLLSVFFVDDDDDRYYDVQTCHHLFDRLISACNLDF